MKKTRLTIKYDLDSYDKNFCLKPPILLILALVFACREYLLPLVVLLGSLKGRSDYGIDVLLQQQHTIAVLSETPALLVLYSMIRRVPTGDSVARWVWRRGRIFLAVAALLDIYLAVAFSGISLGHLHSDNLLTLTRIALDAGILAYLAQSSRLKDVFADFPERVVAGAR